MVAELAEKLQKRVRDVEKVARQAVREHAELSVLHGSLSKHDSRFTWSDTVVVLPVVL